MKYHAFSFLASLAVSVSLVCAPVYAKTPEREPDPVEDAAVETATPSPASAQDTNSQPVDPDTDEKTNLDRISPVTAPASVLDLAPSIAAPITGRASPPMWRLADEDSEVWLLGTFHILPPDLDWRSDALASALDAADTIYFEAEVDTPQAQQKTLQTLMTQGFLPRGETLSALLGESDAAKLKTVSQEVGLPFAAIDTMRPWQAFLALTVQFIVAQGFDPGSGVETVLLKEARARGRALGFFETVEEQLSLFTSLDPAVQLDMLRLTLRDWDSQEGQLQDLLNAWRKGDASGIDQLMNDTMRISAPDVYHALLVRRNEAWTQRIKEVMAGEGKILIAVGAAHLVGVQSVPAMLREEGFNVARFGLEE